MSVEKCLRDAIKAVSDSDLLEEDARQSIVEGMQRVLEDNTKSDARRIAAVINSLQEYRRQAYIAAVSKKVDAATIVSIRGLLEQQPEGERLTFFRRMLETDLHIDRKGQGSAVSSLLRAEESTSVGRLTDVWDEITTRWLNRDTKVADDFLKEVLGLDSGNPRARELVKMYREVEDGLVERARNAGVYVPQRDNYFARRHGEARIVSNVEEWRAWLRENLDPRHHPDPDATADRVFGSLVTTELNARTDTTLSMLRQIHFKDAAAERDYFYRFGEGTVGETAFNHIRELARKVVLAENLGPTPARVVREVLDPLRKEAVVAANKASASADKALEKRLLADRKQGDRAEMIASSMTGELHNPVNQTIANWGAGARNWAVFQMLGKVPLSILGTDALNSVFQNTFHTGGFASSFGKTFAAAVEVIGSKDLRRFAEEMGTWAHAVQSATIDRLTATYATAGEARSLTRRLADGAQRAAGVYMLDNILRSASMVVMSRALLRNSKLGWLDLDARYQRVLRNNGIDEAKWKRLQKTIKARDSLETVDIRALPRDLRDLTMGFLYRELDLAVVHPQHYDRAAMVFGARAGTVSGEVAAVTTQFMSWPISFMRGPVRRVLGAGAVPFTGFAAGMTLAGAMTTQLYALAENEPAFEWDSPELWKRSLTRSGLYSPIGEMFINATTDDRGADVTGPAASLLLQSLSGMGKATRDLIDGDTDRAARRLAGVVESAVVPNHWLLQYSLTSRVMNEVEATLDPRFHRARQRRFLREGRDL